MQQLLTPIRIAIVDDDEDDFDLTSEFIRDIPGGSFQIDWCSSYSKALEIILKSSYDIYFVDYRLGVKTGIDLLKEAVAHQIERPIILLTGKGNQKIDMEAMRLGAVDYLIKSELNGEKLERCIRYALERARTLRELRSSERQYRNIFEKTNDIIFIADAEFKLKNVNRAVFNLLEYEPAELSDVHLYTLFCSEEDKNAFQTRLLSSTKIDDYNAELFTKSGDKKVCMLSATIENDLQGNRYVQGIIHDITLLKKSEEITLQAEKLEAKGRVIRTLAHEVRNPLNNINLSIENLKSETSPEATEYIEIIQRNSKRIDDLINELMDSSRYYKMKLVVLPLQAAMDEALSGAIDRIALNKIKLNLNYTQNPALVMVDRERIKVAFLNIIINAIEAMQKNDGELTITIQSKAGFNQVLIADNGCGIKEEDRVKMFEPYFTSKPTGLGLGLATTHAIIQSHKASIEVASEVGKGSVFTIKFPSL